MKKLLFAAIVISAVSCQNGGINPGNVDFGRFTMKIPGNWKTEKLQGYDSLTGVYFDSLDTDKRNKFQMSGTGLSPNNQRLFLNAAGTLKFKN